MKRILSIICLLPLFLFGQTKLYLNIGTSSTLTPAYNAGWNVTTGAARYKLNTVKDGSTLANHTSAAVGAAAVRKVLIDQFISEPLASQTITGTFTGQIRYDISSTTSTTGQGFVYLRIISNDGSTVVTEVGTATTTNLSTTTTNRTLISLNVGTLSIKPGERICVDIGWNYSSGTNTTRTAFINAGSSAGADLPVDNTTTTASNPWVEFSQTLTFYNPANSAMFALMYNNIPPVPPAYTYATWNPADKDADVTLSGSDLIASGTNQGAVRATIGKASGKWTWEVTLTSTSGVFDIFLGVATAAFDLNTNIGAAATGWGLAQDDGVYYHNGFLGDLVYTTTAGDIITMALDMDAGTLTVYKNGTLINGGPLFTGITGTVFPALNIQFDTVTLTANFGPTLAYPVGGYNEGVYN